MKYLENKRNGCTKLRYKTEKKTSVIPLLGSKNCSFFGSRSRQWLVKAVNVKTVRSSSKDSLSLSLWPSLRDFSNWSSAPKTETISALSPWNKWCRWLSLKSCLWLWLESGDFAILLDSGWEWLQRMNKTNGLNSAFCSFYRVETGWSKLLKTWWDWAGFRVNILVS